MKKFLNKPEDFVDEMVEGIVAAHPDQLTYVEDNLRCIVKAGEKKAGKVGLATGGGSGHLPLFLGYVGEGMLDGCAVGGVFQSPSSEQMINVTKAIDAGAGVLYIYGNYGGDILNFDMAAEMAEMEDIKVLSLVGTDDVASASKGEENKRRGVAGIFFVYKAAGAKADELAPLEEVKRVADKAVANVRTMGVALTPCIVPEVGKPGFTIGDDEMEIGMGIHGEPGIHRGKLQPADEVVDTMMKAILEDLPFQSGDEVSVLINGLGATPKEEMYIVYRRIDKNIERKKASRFSTFTWASSRRPWKWRDFPFRLLKLDDELKTLLAKPAQNALFRTGSVEGIAHADAGNRFRRVDTLWLHYKKMTLFEFFKILKALFDENKELLVELDGRMGDGDLGLTMAKAFTAGYDEMSGTDETDLGKILMKAGMAMAKHAPSTMGTLFATGFMRGGKAIYRQNGNHHRGPCRIFPGLRERHHGEGQVQTGRKDDRRLSQARSGRAVGIQQRRHEKGP